MERLVIVWLIAQQIVSIWVVTQVAKEKHRDPELWGACALLFGVFVVAFVVAMPARPLEANVDRTTLQDRLVDRGSSTYTDGHMSQWRGRR